MNSVELQKMSLFAIGVVWGNRSIHRKSQFYEKYCSFISLKPSLGYTCDTCYSVFVRRYDYAVCISRHLSSGR